MGKCYALRDKGLHERKDTHGRWRTLPACLVVGWRGYIKGGGLEQYYSLEEDVTAPTDEKVLAFE
jgi:hypothetical protein